MRIEYNKTLIYSNLIADSYIWELVENVGKGISCISRGEFIYNWSYFVVVDIFLYVPMPGDANTSRCIVKNHKIDDLACQLLYYCNNYDYKRDG